MSSYLLEIAEVQLPSGEWKRLRDLTEDENGWLQGQLPEEGEPGITLEVDLRLARSEAVVAASPAKM